ncbi:MAG: S1C family serine protease, partial [Nitrososphaerales archaeon]
VVIAGCSSLAPAVQLLAGHPLAAGSSQTTSVISPSTAASNGQAAPAPTSQATTLRVGQPASIVIAPGADVETQINEAVYNKVNASVVYIENLTSLGRSRFGTNAAIPESSGSGWVWDTQGDIVTNNHVVEGADQLNVTFADGTEVPAQVVATDPGSDLAVIKVDPTLADLVPAEQGNMADVKVGERAIAIGNPFGLVGTMTTGIISAVGRSVNVDPTNSGSFSIPQVIQTDAAINPGNSGGPLLNEQGQVIGVNFQIATSNSGTNSGVGFAIPINIVQRVVPSLIKNGGYQHSYLGIRGQTYSPAWAQALNLPKNARGAYVMDVVSGGPAERAGLTGATGGDTNVVLGVDQSGVAYLPAGGDLITAVDGHPVKQFDDLLVYLESNKSPGDKVTLTVLRAGGRQGSVTITLGARPTSGQ